MFNLCIHKVIKLYYEVMYLSQITLDNTLSWANAKHTSWHLHTPQYPKNNILSFSTFSGSILIFRITIQNWEIIQTNPNNRRGAKSATTIHSITPHNICLMKLLFSVLKSQLMSSFCLLKPSGVNGENSNVCLSFPRYQSEHQSYLHQVLIKC